MPLTEDPSLMHFREAWERGESFFVEEVGGEELKRHYTYLRTLPGVKETLDDIEKAGFLCLLSRYSTWLIFQRVLVVYHIRS
jgi:phosphoglycolate phosphatase-like HAD superfamily hydrolase